MKLSLSLLLAFVLPSLVVSQLSGTVGPLTSEAAKAATKTCNILSYGGVASATSDNSASIASAWAACKSGGEVFIPSGSYGLGTWVTLTGGSAVSINLEGTIYRTGTASGNMIYIEHTTDFEFYSANSKGAIQGYGYQFAVGEEPLQFTRHNLKLILSAKMANTEPGFSASTRWWTFPYEGQTATAFHLTLDTCTKGEIYNMVVHGGKEGGLDGIDVWGTNIWVHDVEVTNKDECATVKSPASYIMVENVFCNWSGGCAIGSLGADTDISYVEYNHIFSQNCNQMFMIKSNGRSGTLSNCRFNNFMGHTSAYTLDLNAYWSSGTVTAGSGVEYTDLSFNHWHGTCSYGVTRAPIQLLCPSGVPCTDITITAFCIWNETGSVEYYEFENAYGSGPCLKTGSSYTTYSSAGTVTTTSDYTYTTMSGELSSGLGISKSISIPTIPASFFPSITPYSTLLG